jgi:hypothetical protein
MNLKSAFIKLPLGVLISGIILFSCSYQTIGAENYNDVSLTGTLEGKISIGPLCPVETNPTSPACQPTEETYKAWAIAVWTNNEKSKVKDITPSLDGTYKINLPVGNYTIDFDTKHDNVAGSNNLPISITIETETTTKADINIDTGIR